MSTMEFSGVEIFNAPPERVYTVLTDLDILAASIPEATTVKRVDDKTLEAVVRPGFSFLRGTLKLKIVLDDLIAPAEAGRAWLTMRINASGIGVTMLVTSVIQLVGFENGTKVTWQAAVTELKGLVATLSPGLIRSAADKVIKDGWQNLHAHVA